LRHLCAKRSVALIDLARTLPKDSKYFYDTVHFTDAGCERVGALVADGLRPLMAAPVDPAVPAAE
jgi:hypothetical protein